MPKRSNVIDLSHLAEGHFGLSEPKAAALAEAATVCLQHRGHRTGVELAVHGSFTATPALVFAAPGKKARRSNDDLQEATEDGATAVAIAVATQVTDYRVVGRAMKKTGIDWWLGKEDEVFEARLEVSGILDGPHRVDARIQQKLTQMKQSDETGYPGYAVVVEFSVPQAKMVKK